VNETNVPERDPVLKVHTSLWFDPPYNLSNKSLKVESVSRMVITHESSGLSDFFGLLRYGIFVRHLLPGVAPTLGLE